MEAMKANLKLFSIRVKKFFELIIIAFFFKEFS